MLGKLKKGEQTIFLKILINKLLCMCERERKKEKSCLLKFKIVFIFLLKTVEDYKPDTAYYFYSRHH